MSEHILLVDDDALLRRSLAFNLTQAGYRTSTAASAEDALALARRDQPDLILLDIGLPGMDGLEDGAVWIRVGDTGPGIEPDEMESIFIPFYRGRTGGRFPQGMGLGLSIARDLMAAHSGRLEVDSQPGHGSRFTIWLPLSLGDSCGPR